jgi:hypothetical protein
MKSVVSTLDQNIGDVCENQWFKVMQEDLLALCEGYSSSISTYTSLSTKTYIKWGENCDDSHKIQSGQCLGIPRKLGRNNILNAPGPTC